MDNSMQGAHPVNHHTHVFDPQLTQVSHNIVDGTQPAASTPPPLNPDGSPAKRRPGRPKGSTKKNLLAGEVISHKVKRPVGRPRKDGLPAGSVGPSRVKREPTAAVAAQHPGLPVVPYPGGPLPGYPGLPYGYPMGAPIPPAGLPPPGLFHFDPALQPPPAGENDWVDQARADPDAFLNTLLIALAAPNPVSTTGPSVEEAFKSHLGSLAPNQSTISSLYSIMKTFWLPSSPPYFALTASASSKIPSEHRFLYWDPLPLIFNGISCPHCATPLQNKGRITTGPIKVYDIEKPFFVVGCEYVCRSPPCVQGTTAEGRKFASTDPAILRSLPSRLKDEFPARLLHGEHDVGSGPHTWNWRPLGVSNSLWNLILGCLRSGLRKEVILGLVWGVHHGVPDLNADGPPNPLSSASGSVPNGAAHDASKMDEGQDDEDGEDDHQHETQTLSSTNFSAAYGAATWKESTTTPPTPALNSNASPHVTAPTTASPQHEVPPPPPLAVPPTTHASPSPSINGQPATVAPSAVANTFPPGFNPYMPYPFAPYPYMPHSIMNGHTIPIPTSTAPIQSTDSTPSISTGAMPSDPNVHASPGNRSVQPASSSSHTPAHASPSTPAQTHAQAAAAAITNKRNPRHCCKCGSQECKGKGGRTFCTNACQDCGKLECKGRNSRRPDKKCAEGWQ